MATLLGGRYEVGEVIGRGGMADVHAGFDTRLSRQVAVKILRSDLARDPNFLTRFKREAQSAAGLNHPNIVAIFDSGEEVSFEPNGSRVSVQYIVMEVVEGRTLRDRLTEDGPLPPERAARITEAVLAALAYSHRMGIVHRDIKPANVMVSADGDVKVMDFGIARAVADTAATMTQTQSVLGTAQYLSPEQAQGLNVDARSDIYSAGCLLYELLAGRPPFVGESPVAMAYQHVGEVPQPPSTFATDLPPAYDAVVLHALVKDRDGRYQSAVEFRDDLAAARQGRRLSAAAAGTAAVAPSGQPTEAVTTPAGGAPVPEPADLPEVPGARGDTASLPPVRRDPSAEPPRRHRGRNVALVLATLAALALIFLLGTYYLQREPDVRQVSVPSVVNLDVEEARSLLTAQGLTPQVNPVTNAVVPKDTVTDQQPEADTVVNVGSVVQINVSAGPGQAAVPPVVGQAQADAERALTLAGFTSEPLVVTVDDPSQGKGAVVSTEPVTGVVVPLDTPITLRVASGRVKVPDVVGKDDSVALVTLDALGLTVAREQVEDGGHLEGTVLSQSIPADSVVDVGTQIVLQVATQPAPTPTTATVTTTVVVTPTPTASSTRTGPATTTPPAATTTTTSR